MQGTAVAILVCGGIGAGKTTFCQEFKNYFRHHPIERFDCDQVIKEFLTEESPNRDYYAKRILDEAGVDISALDIDTYSKCTPTQVGIVQSYLVSYLYNAALTRYNNLLKGHCSHDKYLLIDGALVERFEFPVQERIILDCPETTRKERVLKSRGQDYNFDFRASLQLADYARLQLEGHHVDSSVPFERSTFAYLDLIFELRNGNQI